MSVLVNFKFICYLNDLAKINMSEVEETSWTKIKNIILWHC